MNNMGIGILLKAKDDMSSAIQSAERSFLKLDKTSGSVAARMATNGRSMQAGLALAGAGAVGLGGAFALASKAGKFEEAMSNLQVISGATAKEMDDFKQAVIGADQSMFGPVESANALREMAAAGFTAHESLTMLQPVLDLATASLGELGISESAALASQAIKAFGRNAGDTREIVDQMIKSANVFALAPKDLPLAVGVAARGAQALHQSFEETLISVGLVKNVIPTVERAATAAAVAMESMIATGRKGKFLAEVADPIDHLTGKFKPFLTIVDEMTKKLAGMTDSDKAMKLKKAFGAEGGAGISAIMTQLSTGITTTTGAVVKGAEAIAYLRSQIHASQGTAAEVAAAKLNTFGGQMQLLKADFERLAVELGMPFAKALKPLVEGFGKFVTFVKNGLDKMPDSTKKAIAQFVLLGSALAVVVGVALAGLGIMAIFGITFGGIAAVALSVLTPLAGVALAIGGIILLIQAMRVHSEQTGGGMVGFFVGMAQKIKLGFEGLMQLFDEGGFSGKVREDLNKAENSGVKSFAIKIFLWIERIKNFFRGLAIGFSEAMKVAQPIFDEFVNAVKEIASAFGLSVGPANENRSAWESAGDAGRAVGKVLVVVASIITGLLVDGLKTLNDLLIVGGILWSVVGPIISGALTAIKGVLEVIGGILTGDWDMAWKGAGNIALGVLQAIMGVASKVTQTVAAMIDGIVHAASFGKVNLGLEDVVKAGFADANNQAEFLKKELQLNPTARATKASMPDGINPLTSSPLAAAPFYLMNENKIQGLEGGGPNINALAAGFGSSPAAVAAGQANGSSDQLASAMAQLATMLSAQKQQPVQSHVTVKLDHEVVGRAVANSRSDAKARGFGGTAP